MNLETSINQAVEMLKQKDLQGYEIFVISTDTLRAEAKAGKVHSLDRARESGISIRVLKDGAIGFAYARQATPELIESALISAKHQFADDRNHMPTSTGAYAAVLNYDEQISAITPDECIDHAITLEAAARDTDCRIQQIRKASFSRGLTEVRIVNSSGVDMSGKSTGCSASIMVMAKDGDDMQAGYEFGFGHRLSDINVVSIGKQASAMAVAMLGATQIKTMRIPILFDNSSTAEMLELIGDAFLGENVIKGKSYLKDKLGKSCFSPLITLTDNPLDPKASDAFGFDGEGVPSQNNILIEQGLVKSFVYDSYWGRVAGQSSSGNAVRGGYRSMPGLGLRHVCLQPGKDLVATLKDMGSVLKVTDIMGLHTADPISGEFSVGINGFLMEAGEILYPVREAALAGNIYDMFSHVLMVGDDVRGFGRVSSPSILIDAMDISSK